MEPDIAFVDRDASLSSIAISLKRIADGIDAFNSNPNAYGETGFAQLARAIVDGLQRTR